MKKLLSAAFALTLLLGGCQAGFQQRGLDAQGSYVSTSRPAIQVAVPGLAWKAGIAAEVLAAPPLSVGGMLYRAKIYLETPEMLAWTLCVILISMCLERLLALFFKRIEARGRRLA